jgi:hypothetical protein
MEFFGEDKASTPLHRIFTHILFARGGEKVMKGLYFTHKYPFLAIHAKGGESISPKQKDRTTTNFRKCSLFNLY